MVVSKRIFEYSSGSQRWISKTSCGREYTM